MRQSLLVRLLLFTLLFLLLLMAAVGYVLDAVYRQGQLQDWQQRIQVHSYNLLALVEERDQQLVLPERLQNQRFNNRDSGLFAVVEKAGEVVWRTPSAQTLGRFSSGWSDVGEWQFSRASNGEQEMLIARFGFEWQPLNSAVAPRIYNLVLAETSERLDAVSREFQRQLWQLLVEIVVALMVLQALILRLGLRPLRRMSDELEILQQGQSSQLQNDYPRELQPLITNFNRVLTAEQSQRERYRNTVADVSHSLKTPLTVLKGMLPNVVLPNEQKQEIATQLERMSDTVQYQLQRAMTGSRVSAAQRIAVAPVVESVLSALKKVYADKGIDWHIDCQSSCYFYGDDNDLMEIIGNLTDNASKYCQQQVRVRLLRENSQCCFMVEDDGPGIPVTQYEQVLRRGVRLDSQQPGQGFGLALVKDILDAYQAQLRISRSPLGGACFEVRWEGDRHDSRG
ncbi:hypothetical protein CHH28_00985 [Bacterioplanes sanyensis]|uniref:histidine kinase n=1 Tax=Bacterioplanes sanyensis TaxID=1249553 RepID=A0A222FGI5_9GAMM|nr:ATP-binding protein [Bacterioplanes sanyensis]ASP37343.1 hypothetical protein CHH28_00985 [Bacterioplanes sanyensis]